MFSDVIAEISNTAVSPDQLAGEGALLLDLLLLCGLCPSRGQARRDLEGGGIYVKNRRSFGVDQRVDMEHLLFGRYLLLRKGKKSYAALAVTGCSEGRKLRRPAARG